MPSSPPSLQSWSSAMPATYSPTPRGVWPLPMPSSFVACYCFNAPLFQPLKHLTNAPLVQQLIILTSQNPLLRRPMVQQYTHHSWPSSGSGSCWWLLSLFKAQSKFTWPLPSIPVPQPSPGKGDCCLVCTCYVKRLEFYILSYNFFPNLNSGGKGKYRNDRL